MKTNQLIIFILVLLTSISFVKCVEDGDFTVPQDLGAAENMKILEILEDLKNPNGSVEEISITNLKSLFVEHEITEITTDLIVKGYVSSSDRAGNFFKEFFIQNKLENPTAAIQVLLDATDTYNKFNLGREVYIRLTGLSIGEARSGNGIIAIGVENGDVVNAIQSSKIDNHLLRSSKSGTLLALPIGISEITSDNIGMYVQISNAQFPRSIKELTFGDPQEKFDTQRAIESCETSGNISLETSSFASFNFAPLPKERFTMNAVVSKTFNGSDIVLVLNDKNDLKETGGRCDPKFLECTDNTGSHTVIFSENFENFTSFASKGWDIVNIDDKKTTWTEGSFNKNAFAQITAFRTGDKNEKVWLISPEINLEKSSGEQLSLDIQTSFNNGEILTVWACTDYDGEDPTTATWQLLDVDIPTGSANGFGSFETINPVNLSCLDGSIHIGFLYSSSEDRATTRYHIDNFEILAD